MWVESVYLVPQILNMLSKHSTTELQAQLNKKLRETVLGLQVADPETAFCIWDSVMSPLILPPYQAQIRFQVSCL